MGLVIKKNGDAWEGQMHEIYCVECNTIMSDYSPRMVEEKWNRRFQPNREMD